jgi:hypothetical protein
LPDVLVSRFTNERQAWRDELLDANSPEILTKGRERAPPARERSNWNSCRGDVATTILDIAHSLLAGVFGHSI